MGQLSASKRAALAAKIVRLEALLEVAYTAYEQALTSSKKSYKLDTGEAMQSAVQRSLEEQQKAIDSIEARIDYLRRRLRGALNVNLNVRRKRG
jgi:ribonuclease HII